MTRQLMYYTLLIANDPEMVDELSKEQRAWLENIVKNTAVDNCLECPCFAWKFDEKGKISGNLCALGGIVNENEKGKCFGT